MSVLTKTTTVSKRPGERSFTLLETVLAIAIMATIILHVVGSLGNIVYFSGYTRRSAEAMYLAKRLMSQVEYHWSHLPFKDLTANEEDRKFTNDESDYRYKLEIKEFKLPIFDLMNSGGNKTEEDGKEKEEDKKEDNSGLGSMIQQFLGTDEIMKTAYVEVSWPEGAKKNSVSLTLLLTNQRAIDEKLVQFESQANELKKIAMNGGSPAGGQGGTGGPGGQGGTGGTNPSGTNPGTGGTNPGGAGGTNPGGAGGTNPGGGSNGGSRSGSGGANSSGGGF